MTVVEEAHCLVTVLYRMLSNLLPNHLRPLFEEKCVEALIASPNRPPPTALQANGVQYRNPRRALASPPNNNVQVTRSPSPHQTCDATTQTFSTGEINVIDIYYDSWVIVIRSNIVAALFYSFHINADINNDYVIVVVLGLCFLNGMALSVCCCLAGCCNELK